MFDLDAFVADCRAALREDSSHKAVREVVARAVSDPAAVIKGLGEPKRGEVQKLHGSEDLTVINVIWAPRMTIMPHNHEMWAVIGVYTGREDNIFWRRLPEDAQGRLEAAGAKSLAARDAVPLGRDIIHSVTNPVPLRLRRRFLRPAAQRVGPGDALRAALRRDQEHAAVRGSQRPTRRRVTRKTGPPASIISQAVAQARAERFQAGAGVAGGSEPAERAVRVAPSPPMALPDLLRTTASKT
jgi:hypothetical protein